MKDWNLVFLRTPLYPSVDGHHGQGLEKTVGFLCQSVGVAHPAALFARHLVRLDAVTQKMRRVDLTRDDDRAHLRCVWKRQLRAAGAPAALVAQFTVPTTWRGSRSGW